MPRANVPKVAVEVGVRYNKERCVKVVPDGTVNIGIEVVPQNWLVRVNRTSAQRSETSRRAWFVKSSTASGGRREARRRETRGGGRG